jgi:hypothetical protein
MFYSETELENFIRAIISEEISTSMPEIVVLQNKDVVDILICKNYEIPQLFFIEAKFHKVSNGRIGFGNGQGGLST